LLSNSLKFTPPGGTVTISACRDGSVAVIRVTDTGIGIPEADKKYLFNRFFRGSNAVSAALPGTGLGLSIARTIVANHDGEVSLQSEEGKGTTVSVRLPLPLAGAGADPEAHAKALGLPSGRAVPWQAAHFG
jgi:signal transduction histidine kinase